MSVPSPSDTSALVKLIPKSWTVTLASLSRGDQKFVTICPSSHSWRVTTSRALKTTSRVSMLCVASVRITTSGCSSISVTRKNSGLHKVKRIRPMMMNRNDSKAATPLPPRRAQLR